MSIQIISINVGKPKPLHDQGTEITTAIFKEPSEQPLFLCQLNLAGDAQADLIHHGGKDKAVCVYCYEHYAYWENELERQLGFGAFGENVTVTGMLETDVCIGDIYSLGGAVVQVSQPRQPCYKLEKRHHVPDLAAQVKAKGFTGFYLRVLQEGTVSKDKGMKLLERHPKEVSVYFANRIMNFEKENVEGMNRLLAVDALSQNWRATLERRISN